MSEVGFCSRCKQNVILKREEIDYCLLFTLLFFTIIGGIIYYYIYSKKPANLCAHCNSRVVPIGQTQPSFSNSPEPTNNYESSPDISIQPEYQHLSIQDTKNEKKKHLYCEFCGEKNDLGARFCPNCGIKL